MNFPFTFNINAANRGPIWVVQWGRAEVLTIFPPSPTIIMTEGGPVFIPPMPVIPENAP